MQNEIKYIYITSTEQQFNQLRQKGKLKRNKKYLMKLSIYNLSLLKSDKFLHIADNGIWLLTILFIGQNSTEETVNV